MKKYSLILIFVSFTGITLAQTPSNSQEKVKEDESGVTHTDSTNSRVISGSAQGKSKSSSVTFADSLKQDHSADTVIIDQPIPKGQ